MEKICVKETVVIKSQFFSVGEKGYRCTLQGNGRRTATDASGGRGVVLEVGVLYTSAIHILQYGRGWQAG